MHGAFQTFGRLTAVVIVLIFAFAVLPENAGIRSAYAHCGGGLGDCSPAAAIVRKNHRIARKTITEWIAKEFTQHKDWLTVEFAQGHVIPALQRMSAQLSSVGMFQMFAIGTMFDSRQQLKTQRLYQELELEAQKDYQPSEDFCWFGTNVRSLAHSDARARYNAYAMSQRALARQLGTVGTAGAKSQDDDFESRWNQYVFRYCDPKDNNWTGDGTGMEAVCSFETDPQRRNRDIDFTGLIEHARTLEIDFTNSSKTNDEEDVMALSSNLFGHSVLSRALRGSTLTKQGQQESYFALRSVAAKRSVAQHSFDSIVGLKSSGTTKAAETAQFLGAIMKELGIPEEEISLILGENPSYYAQLEVLAKRIFQSPTFYANLYDTPANIRRKSAALKAIEMILDRAIYESQLRQEMTTSVLLSSELENDFAKVNGPLGDK